VATVNLGRIKPVFRGAFNNSTAYVIDDIVTSGNETFIAIAATQGNATTDASKWTKLAAKGADGTDVAATLQNKEIAFKTNAGALDGIPIGTAGQFLKVNSGATGYEYATVSAGTILQAKVAQYFGGTIVSTSSTGVDVSTLHSDYDHVKVDITPASTASKFLIQIGGAFSSSSANYGMFYMRRSVASSNTTTLTGGRHIGNGQGDSHNFVSTQFFDAPNTTSVVNYRLFARRHSSNSIAVNDIGTSDNVGGGLYIHVYEYDGSKVTITSG
jgi:hypothetical protein